MAKLGGVVCVVLMCMLVVALAPHAEGAITCGLVASSLSPCFSYLQSGGKGNPPSGCCNGIRFLKSAAKTTPDRQAVCNCLKALARGMNVGPAAGLPKKCGVDVGYAISPSTDCSKVH